MEADHFLHMEYASLWMRMALDVFGIGPPESLTA